MQPRFFFLLLCVFGLILIFNIGAVVNDFLQIERDHSEAFNFLSRVFELRISFIRLGDLRKNFLISGNEEYLNTALNHTEQVKYCIEQMGRIKLTDAERKILDRISYLRFQNEQYFNYLVENINKEAEQSIHVIINKIILSQEELFALCNALAAGENRLARTNYDYRIFAVRMILIITEAVLFTLLSFLYLRTRFTGGLLVLSKRFEKFLDEPLEEFSSDGFSGIIREHADNMAQFIDRFHVLQDDLIQSRRGNTLLIDELKVLKANYEKELLKAAEELKIAQRKLSSSERLAALGQLAAGVAHEIRNPLAGIQGAVSIIGRRFVSEEGQDIIKEIIFEIDRLNHIVQSLLDFSAPVVIARSECRISDLIKRSFFAIDDTVEKKKIQLTVDGDDSQMAFVDGDKLIQVLGNLLKNSCEAVSEGGSVAVKYYKHIEKYKPELVKIEISDNGPGISETHRENVFNPFYTTKKSGTGLGLSIAYSIIREHGGNISLKNCTDSGCVFEISLPVTEKG